MRVLTLAMKASAMPSCTSSREPAQQTWPWLNQMPSTRPFDRAVEIGVLEHDEGRLAAELQRQFLAGAGGRLADDLADFRRAGEGDLVDAGMVDDGRTRARTARHDVDDAFRHAGALADFGEQDRRQRREFGRFQHDGAAGGQRRRDLPGEHQQREIPRDDLADDADRPVAGKFAVQRLRPAGMVA